MDETEEFVNLKLTLWLPQLGKGYMQISLHFTPLGKFTYLLCPGDRIRVSLHQLLGSDCLRLRCTGDLEEQRKSMSMATPVEGDPTEQSFPIQRSFNLVRRLQGWFSCCTEKMRVICVAEQREGMQHV